MLPWTGFALVALYVGYVAYDARRLRETATAAPPRVDPIHELERVNTELALVATHSRQSLERARDAMQRGLRG